MTLRHSYFQLVSRIAFFLLAILVAYLSVGSFPSDAPPGNKITRMIATVLFGDTTHADKVGHFMAYVTLGAAAVFAALVRRPIWAPPVLLAFFGAGLEGAQYFVDGRHPDLADAAVNGVGAVLGCLLAHGAVRAVVFATR